MTASQENRAFILRQLTHFLRSCREEGVPAERARESLAQLGFDRTLIAEADHKIDDPGMLEEDDADRSAFIPILLQLRGELAMQIEQARHVSAPVAHQPVRLSLVQGGALDRPPPPPSEPPREANANSSRGAKADLPRGATDEDDTLPCFTVQGLAAVSLLTSPETSSAATSHDPHDSPHDSKDASDDGLTLSSPSAPDDSFQNRIMRAGPAALTVVAVAWAALHMPQAHKPLRYREALTAAPASTTTGRALPSAAGQVADSVGVSVRRPAGAVLPAASALVPPMEAPMDENAATSDRKALPSGAFYHRLKSSLREGMQPVASVGTIDGSQNSLVKAGAHTPQLHTIWWHEDETKRAVAPESLDIQETAEP